MCAKLESLNINGKFLEIIKICMKNLMVQLKHKIKLLTFQSKRGVRQGCPLSPILFNIYTNDIAYKLEGINLAPLELPNGTLVSCLMYADDSIILSRSPSGDLRQGSSNNSVTNFVPGFSNIFRRETQPSFEELLLVVLVILRRRLAIRF